VEGSPWDSLGSDDLCPKKAVLEYDEQYDEGSGEVTEQWYFQLRRRTAG
jgi:hypothetical protein